jgi:hypothetical protein
MEINKQKTKEIEEETSSGEKATHSGWQFYYIEFSKCREDCIRLGGIINASNINQASEALKPYHSALYNMAQQIFPFYTEKDEKSLTTTWLKLGTTINEYLLMFNDKMMRAQMGYDMINEIPIDVRQPLFSFFNKIYRMAVDAGLLVNKEEKKMKEQKRGLLGV